MTKKEGGNLQTKDYIDEVYTKNPSKDMFVEAHGSDLFVNMLIVLHQEKVETFQEKMDTMMAEYYAMVAGAVEGLRLQVLAEDPGWGMRLRFWTDARSAKSASARRGLGKIRHMETNFLW